MGAWHNENTNFLFIIPGVMHCIALIEHALVFRKNHKWPIPLALGDSIVS